MNPFAKTFSLTACALAASLMISACGGGSSTDVTKPTVNITSSADAAGVVTFTFTFSEPVRSFTKENVTVTGGNYGVFAASTTLPNVYTLTVTPTTGPITVALSAGILSDLAGNPIDVVPATPGSTTTAGGTTTTTAAGATSTTAAATSTTAAATSTTAAATSTTAAATSTTAAATSTTAGATSTTATVTTTTVAPGPAPTVAITATPLTGGNVRFIFNFSANVGTSFTTSDVAIVGGGAATVGTAPAVGVQQSTTNPLIYTLDVTPTAVAVNVTIAANAFSASNATNTAAAALNYTVPFIFASDYYDGGSGTSIGIDTATGNSKIASAEGGAFGIYWDKAAGVKAAIWWGQVYSTFGKSADPSVGWGWGIDSTATKPGWLAGYVNAPNNVTADVSARNNLEIVLNANSQLAATSPTFSVLLVSPDVGTGATACTPKLTGSVKLTDITGLAFPLYKLPLSGFTLNSPACTGYTTAADVLKKVSAVHVQATSDIQYKTQAVDQTTKAPLVPATYANGFVLGKIYFD